MSSFKPRRFGSDTILQSIPRSRRTIHSFHRMHHDWNFQLGICTTVFSTMVLMAPVPGLLAVGIESRV